MKNTVMWNLVWLRNTSDAGRLNQTVLHLSKQCSSACPAQSQIVASKRAKTDSTSKQEPPEFNPKYVNVCHISYINRTSAILYIHRYIVIL